MSRFIGIGVLTQEIEPFKEILNFGQNFRASPPLKFLPFAFLLMIFRSGKRWNRIN